MRRYRHEGKKGREEVNTRYIKAVQGGVGRKGEKRIKKRRNRRSRVELKAMQV